MRRTCRPDEKGGGSYKAAALIVYTADGLLNRQQSALRNTEIAPRGARLSRQEEGYSFDRALVQDLLAELRYRAVVRQQHLFSSRVRSGNQLLFKRSQYRTVGTRQRSSQRGLYL